MIKHINLPNPVIMNRFFPIIVYLSFILISCKTQQTVIPQKEVSTVPTEKALLWEISGNELANPSYLYGTIHMIGKKDFFLSEVTKSSLEKTQKVTFEINMEDMSDVSKLMPLMMQAFMSDNQTLKGLLSEEDYTLVKNHFEKIGLPIMFLDRIKPMFLSALTSEDMLTLGQGSQSQMTSYELEIMEIAKTQNKEIGGLETMEYQMSMFDSIPYKAQAQMLVESIKSSNSTDDQFQKMVDMYKDQDIQGMQNMVDNDEEGIGAYEELLLINRNKNWIPIMGQMMVENATFFAVGAGHLGGDQGVISLLRKEGYTVKPLSQSKS